jgi:hypothetical protein
MSLRAVARWPHWEIAAQIAALAGALSAFVDLMTTLPGALALTIAGAALGVYAAGSAPAPRGTWHVPVAAAGGWLVGFAWMWASKWMIAAAGLGIRSVVDNVKAQLEFRLSGEYRGVDPWRFRGFSENLGVWWDRPLMPLTVGAILVVLIVVAVRQHVNRRVIWPVTVSGVIVIGLVVTWYVVLNNHSQIHAWLVYRSLPLAFGGLSALTYVALTVGPQSGGRSVPRSTDHEVRITDTQEVPVREAVSVS